jgi:hypothetical protein
LALIALPAGASAPKSAGLASYAKARSVLDAGVDAMGGRDALDAVRSVRREFEGEWRGFGQSRRPDRDGAPLVFHEKDEAIVHIDYQRGDWYERLKYAQYGRRSEYAVQTDWARGGEAYQTFAYIEEPPFARRIDAAETPALRAEKLRRYPEGALRAAMRRAETLQWSGSYRRDGRQYHVISFADETGARPLLHFDARTRLLAKVEAVRAHPVVGDTFAETLFDDYRTFGDIRLPLSHVDRVAGVATQSWRASSIAVNAPPPETQAPPSPSPSPAAPAVRRIAAGAYVIEGPYNVLFAEFRDFALVVEAPQNSAYAEECLRLIRQTIPDKPLRLVATHFHYDHVGGVRPYIAAGATILTTPDAKPVIERAAASRQTLRPDALSRRPAAPRIEIVDEEIAIDDGAARALIFDIGPTDHAAEMLAVYLPEARILYEADLWDPHSETRLCGIRCDAACRGDRRARPCCRCDRPRARGRGGPSDAAPRPRHPRQICGALTGRRPSSLRPRSGGAASRLSNGAKALRHRPHGLCAVLAYSHRDRMLRPGINRGEIMARIALWTALLAAVVVSVASAASNRARTAAPYFAPDSMLARAVDRGNLSRSFRLLSDLSRHGAARADLTAVAATDGVRPASFVSGGAECQFAIAKTYDPLPPSAGAAFKITTRVENTGGACAEPNGVYFYDYQSTRNIAAAADLTPVNLTQTPLAHFSLSEPDPDGMNLSTGYLNPWRVDIYQFAGPIPAGWTFQFERQLTAAAAPVAPSGADWPNSPPFVYSCAFGAHQVNFDVGAESSATNAGGYDYKECAIGQVTLCLPTAQLPDLDAWWRFDGDGAEQMFGNNFSSYPTAVDVAGYVGQGFRNSTSGSLQVAPVNPALNLGRGDFTIDLWIDVTASGFSGGVFDKGFLAGPKYGLKLVGGKPVFWMADAAGSTDFPHSTVIAGKGWHFIAIAVERDNPAGLLFYVRPGAPAFGAAASVVLDPTPRSGSLDSQGFLHFRTSAATIDELEIFDRALTVAELEAIYNAHHSGKCR